MKAIATILLLQALFTFAPRPASATERCVAPPIGLVNYWRAEGNGADSAGNLDGFNIARLGYGPGITGSAFEYLPALGVSRLSFGGTPLPPPWTFCAWIWREDSPARSASLLLDERTAIKLEQFGTERAIGLTRFGVLDFSFGVTIPRATWTHLALVASPSGTKLYLNGELRITLPFLIELPRKFLGGAQDDQLTGRIDELMTFDRALTADEIQCVKNLPSQLNQPTAPSSPGLALNFLAPGTYARVPNLPALNSLPFTVATWLRTTQSHATVLSKLNTDGRTPDGWRVYLNDGRLRASCQNTAGSLTDGGAILDAGFVADGKWHYVGFSVDETGGYLSVDGQLVQRGWRGTPGVGAPGRALILGANPDDPTTSFLGQLDEFSLWRRSLPQRELQINAQRILEQGEPGLIAYCRMNEAYGKALTSDFTGNIPISLTGRVAWTTSDIWQNRTPTGPGPALRFDGPDARVTVTEAGPFNAFPLTLMAWFKTEQTNTSDLINKLLPGSSNGYQLSLVAGHLRAHYFRHDTSAVGGDDTGLHAGPVNDGRWHHAALTIDAQGGRLYLDGILSDSRSWIGTPGATTTTAPLTFNLVSGCLDQVSLWNMALTADQIRTNRFRNELVNTPGIIADFRFDEGEGNTTKGRTPAPGGSLGRLTGGISWTPSDAPVGAPIVPPVITTWLPTPNGQSAVLARGLSGYGYVLQGTSDLRTWRNLGLAAELYPGFFQCYAPGSGTSTATYFRLVNP